MDTGCNYSGPDINPLGEDFPAKRLMHKSVVIDLENRSDDGEGFYILASEMKPEKAFES